MAKCLLDELVDGLSAADEQVNEFRPSEDENVEQIMDHGLSSTQVILVFDLIHILPDLTFLYLFLIIPFFARTPWSACESNCWMCWRMG